MVSITKITANGSLTNWCSGTIISTTFVLTAAHCVERNNTHELLLVFGSTDFADEDGFHRVEREIKGHYIHPRYDTKYHYFDLALIEVDIPLEFSLGIQSICLPDSATADVDFRANDAATLIGYGLKRPNNLL